MNTKARLLSWIGYIQKFSDRSWYALLIGFLAAADNLIVIIPTDGIAISSTMLSPRRWLLFGLSIGFGSSLGALALAYLVQAHGAGLIYYIVAYFEGTSSWEWASHFFAHYGLWVVFIVSVSPLPQHPAIILAALSGSPIVDIFLASLSGRLIKYLLLSYLASHAPQLLQRLWGIKSEIEEVERAALSSKDPP